MCCPHCLRTITYLGEYLLAESPCRIESFNRIAQLYAERSQRDIVVGGADWTMDAMAGLQFGEHALQTRLEDDTGGDITVRGIGEPAEGRNAGKNLEELHDSIPSFGRSGAWPFRLRQSRSHTPGLFMFLIILSVWINFSSAAFINFENCLAESYISSNPLKLQFKPLFVNAIFDITNPSHNLQVTVYGDVNGTGPLDLVAEPDLNNTAYWNSNQTQLGGKIERQPDPSVGYYTTLFNKVNVITYEPYSSPGVDFCESLQNGYACPLGPVVTVVPAKNL